MFVVSECGLYNREYSAADKRVVNVDVKRHVSDWELFHLGATYNQEAPLVTGTAERIDQAMAYLIHCQNERLAVCNFSELDAWVRGSVESVGYRDAKTGLRIEGRWDTNDDYICGDCDKNIVHAGGGPRCDVCYQASLANAPKEVAPSNVNCVSCGGFASPRYEEKNICGACYRDSLANNT